MLKEIPIFSGLSDLEFEKLEKVAVLKTFPKNTILFSEGDQSDSFYVILSGKVNVGINDEEGREVILSILGEGEYFGEMALMDGEPRSAFVMTKEPTQLLIVSKKDFQNLVGSNPEIIYNVLKGLLKRLREANKKIESLALMNVYGRVARLLIQLSETRGDMTMIRDKLTHQEIANMVGASREMVSRVLKELSDQGYITIQKKRISLHGKLPFDW